MYEFTARGHENIKATHKTTLEFTKDAEVSEMGDCIVGVKADFDSTRLQELAKTGSYARIEIEASGEKDSFIAELNSTFSDDKEFVVRMGEFASERTFAVRAEKSAMYLSEKLKRELRKAETVIHVRIINQQLS